MPSSIEQFPWVAGYRAFETEMHDFGDLCRDMGDWGISFLAQGMLAFRGEEIGTWRHDTLIGDETAACPLVGPRIGAVAFDVFSWASDSDARHELFCGLMKHGRDMIVHRPSGHRWHAVHLRNRTLPGACGKYSLDDGAELLTRNPGAYAAWMVDAAQTAQGSAPEICWAPTAHNCLRALDDAPVRRVDVRLWLFDFAILEAIEQRFLEDNR